MTHSATKIWFDGGARPNPGPIEVAAVVRGTTTIIGGLASGSNTQAEWLALLHALEVAAGLGVRDVVLLGDALTVVRQAGGAQKCRGAEAQGFLAQFQVKAAGFDRVRVRHVGRSHNLAGIALERRKSGLDG